MALALTNLSWRFWSRKHHHHHEDPKISKGVSLNSKYDNSGMFDSDALRFPWVKNCMASSSSSSCSSSRKMRRKWHNYNGREMIDDEYDVVVVPSDGEGCVSGCESNGCDWSIGWLEPHGGGLWSDNESDDNSFAVIVPCYQYQGGGLVNKVKDTNANILKHAAYFPYDHHNHESMKYVESWLSSLRNS